MSIKSHVIANLLGQFWGTLLGIVMVPLYLQHLGIEAYALIGFNAVLQTCLALLDVGLSPTFSREAARLRAGGASPHDTGSFLVSAERIFAMVSGLLFAAAALASERIASQWFSAERVPSSVIALCIVFMAGMAGARWLAALYRGGIVGMERIVWINAFTSGVHTVRFAGVVPVISIWPSLEAFFGFQFATTLVEAAVLRVYLFRSLAPYGVRRPSFSWRIIKRHGRLAASLAFTGAIWVFVTQSDKLLLSKLLSLQSYGYVSLAVLVASGISILSFALLQSFQPRFNFLAAKDGVGGKDLTAIYHLSTQLTVAALLPAAAVMAAWPQTVIYGWTGNAEVAIECARLLPFYALGNVFIALLSSAYFLQVAHGFLRLHVISNVIFGVTLVPLVIYTAQEYGAQGAAILWFAQSLLFLLCWPAIVHHYLLPGETRRWYFEDLLLPAVSVLTVTIGARILWPDNATGGRWMSLAACAGLAGSLYAVAAAAAPELRMRLVAYVRGLPPLRHRPRAS